MGEITINRRQAVRAAAGVAAGGLLVTSAGVGAASAASNGLVGSWLVTITDDESGDEGLVVASFVDGGVFISNDVRPAGGVGTGSWEDKGDDKFKVTFWVGNPADDHSIKVEVWGKLDGDEISGRYEGTVYDSDGEEVDSFKGTFTGEPLEA